MRLSVKEAAELLQVSQQYIRIGLQRGILPFGYAVKMSSKYTYHISKNQVINYISKEEKQPCQEL